MGCCLSSDSDHSLRQKPTADVISLNGELRRYPLPVTVSRVLQFEALSPDSFFICNSDSFFFDEYVPRLEPGNELEPDAIYFVLPVSKLKHRLAASDMAALAVKASVAVNASNPRWSRKSRISSTLDSQCSNTGPVQNDHVESKKVSKGSARPELVASKPGSVRKLQRYSSQRAKSAVRSFKMKLTTINEGSVLLLN